MVAAETVPASSRLAPINKAMNRRMILLSSCWVPEARQAHFILPDSHPQGKKIPDTVGLSAPPPALEILKTAAPTTLDAEGLRDSLIRNH